ncbi:MAG: SDR family oxidoreductase [Bacteroidota bacterium]
MEENSISYALVTGGTSGIGYELSKLLARDGYNLIIVARDENELSSTASALSRQFGINVVTFSKDLFDPENAFKLYEEVIARNIDIDILINDAGHGLYGEFTETDVRKELNIINLNVSSLVVLTKLFLRDMIEKGSGRIMNLSSIASKSPGPWQSVYHGTKAFVQSFTEAVRSEVKNTGVTITALLPGATNTDFFNKAGMLQSKVVQEDNLADAADVAKDGYEAMMNGDDMIISGFKNKMQVAMGSITPDAKLADKMKKAQEPARDDHK